jgi:hypothetical protein
MIEPTASDLIFLDRRITIAGTTVLAGARAWLEHQRILLFPDLAWVTIAVGSVAVVPGTASAAGGRLDD